MRIRWANVLPVLSVSIAALIGASCGKERDAARPMTEGERLTLVAGCTSCHGPNGEGGVGPKLVGLYGSTVTLADGSKVVADDTYLTTAIKDPSAQLLKGYIAMPPNALGDDDVAKIVEFIKSLK